MNYKLVLSNKNNYIITETEFKSLNGKSGLIFLTSLGGVINMSHVISILPEKLEDFKIKDGETYYLHDGGRVKRQFNTWVDADNPEIKADKSYYTELNEDLVFTWNEFKEIKNLDTKSRLEKLLNKKNDVVCA